MRNIFETIKDVEAGLVPLVETVALGNGTAITMAVWRTHDGRIHLAVERNGYYTFDHWVSPDYAREKVIDNPVDAVVVAEYVNRLLGYEPTGVES